MANRARLATQPSPANYLHHQSIPPFPAPGISLPQVFDDVMTLLPLCKTALRIWDTGKGDVKDLMHSGACIAYLRGFMEGQKSR